MEQVKSEKLGLARNAVVIYHANCVDGFASAWCFHRLMEEHYAGEIKYIAMNYGDLLGPRVASEDFYARENDLYILDFSFPRGLLVDYAAMFAKVILLDHHKTAQEALSNWTNKPENLEIVFDMSRSGAGISWDYFAQKIVDEISGIDGIVRPPLIDYIEDRDIWKWKLPDSQQVNARIALCEFDFNKYTRLNNRMKQAGGLAQVAIEGSLLEEQRSKYIDMIISECSRKITIDGKEGLVCNAPGFLASELCNLLAIKSGTYGASYYHDSGDSVKFSLRSIGAYDVSEIAKTFGGGGHRNAAGFVLSEGTGHDNGIIIWSGSEDAPEGFLTFGLDATKQS